MACFVAGLKGAAPCDVGIEGGGGTADVIRRGDVVFGFEALTHLLAMVRGFLNGEEHVALRGFAGLQTRQGSWRWRWRRRRRGEWDGNARRVGGGEAADEAWKLAASVGDHLIERIDPCRGRFGGCASGAGSGSGLEGFATTGRVGGGGVACEGVGWGEVEPRRGSGRVASWVK